MSTNNQRAAAQFTESNRRAAEIILAKAKPGDDGLAVQWARGILADKAQLARGTLHDPEKTAYD